MQAIEFNIIPFTPITPQSALLFYAEKQKGFAQWSSVKNLIYQHISSKEGYMAYLKEAYPESPYLIKIDYEISASNIYSWYDENEVQADEKFKGKRIAITGIIKSIEKDFMDDPYIVFEVDFLKNVNCSFNKENIKLISHLQKGQKVIIIRTCNGFILKSVMIKDCELW